MQSSPVFTCLSAGICVSYKHSVVQIDSRVVRGGLMSEAVTRGVRVTAQARFHPEKSSKEDDYFFFSYQITIANESQQTVQLLSRHWKIHDADGNLEEVVGEGVVGDQPIIHPGSQYTYSSFCPLKTEVGSMSGTYQMITDKGERFDAVIAPFTLARPHSIN